MDTVQERVRICNSKGLHARAAAKFVALVNSFEANVTVRRDCDSADIDAGSIMDLLMLAAGPGTHLDIRAEGPDAREAANALRQLVEAGFHEDLADIAP
ncbi:HPr family phosphocarrier protein [Hyphobacterium marinum]|uniref:HPr family phosphocarrier protein n=1 Tax=Hyphobacterium marinum TaxID=3116574 RepID=A0ABU7LUG5_9PROT|nr:HPr family phosphocarrier protein [Hyphobacterium sp. Y6023]MEE2565196.1 HPr family phosphocarrier protein [Hyphobacterium sp. Y6023]